MEINLDISDRHKSEYCWQDIGDKEKKILWKKSKEQAGAEQGQAQV